MNQLEFQNQWTSNGHFEPGQAIENIMRKLVPDMVKAIFGEVVQSTANEVRNSMSRRY